MRHYVYRHIRLDSNNPFYVGKGVGSRAYRMSIRNPYHKNIVNKHGVKVEILKYFKTHEEALNFEKKLILLYFNYNIKLVNMSLGGEGQVIKRSPVAKEVREKISKKLKGRKLSKEVRLKMGNSRKGSRNPLFRGYYITPFGKFTSTPEAEKVLGVKAATINYRCKKSTRYTKWSFLPC